RPAAAARSSPSAPAATAPTPTPRVSPQPSRAAAASQARQDPGAGTGTAAPPSRLPALNISSLFVYTLACQKKLLNKGEQDKDLPERVRVSALWPTLCQ